MDRKGFEPLKHYATRAWIVPINHSRISPDFMSKVFRYKYQLNRKAQISTCVSTIAIPCIVFYTFQHVSTCNPETAGHCAAQPVPALPPLLVRMCCSLDFSGGSFTCAASSMGCDVLVLARDRSSCGTMEWISASNCPSTLEHAESAPAHVSLHLESRIELSRTNPARQIPAHFSFVSIHISSQYIDHQYLAWAKRRICSRVDATRLWCVVCSTLYGEHQWHSIDGWVYPSHYTRMGAA